jgi:hypothetical protein
VLLVIEDEPLIDNHAHPFLVADRAAAGSFSRFFTEASFPQPQTLFYRQALRDLATLLGCRDDEPASWRLAKKRAMRTAW